METVSENGTYKELFRSTVGIIKRIQHDLVDKMSTQDVLEYASGVLKKSKISINANLQAVAVDLDKGHQVEVEFRFDSRLKDFYGQDARDIYRAVYSMSLSVESVFDKLQSPIICKVGEKVYGDGRLPVGFRAVLWRLK